MVKKKFIKKSVKAEEPVSYEFSTVDSIQEVHIDFFSTVINQDFESLEAVLRDGADVKAQSCVLRITALHIASAQGNGILTSLLLRAGADPKVADKLGRTPLHMAASAGSEVCVGLLLAAGAKPNIPRHVKLPSRKIGVVKQMQNPKATVPLDTLDLNLHNNECFGRTPLHQAVKANSPSCARILLEAKATVDATDEHCMTPLLLAGEGLQSEEREAVRNYEELVEILLKYSAHPNVVNDSTGETALHRAVSLKSVKTTKCLLENGANPLMSSSSGGHMTAVHLAAKKGSPEILTVIFQSVRDTSVRRKMANAADGKGCTPLHLAANTGCHACVSILMGHSADLGAVAKSGTSALDALLLYLPRPIQYLTNIFDSRIRSNDVTVDDRTFALHLDFVPLAPHKEEKQSGVLRAILESTSSTTKIRRTLLSHPLVEAFIVLKWRRLSLFFHFLVSAYVAFVLSLSTYVTLIHNDVNHSRYILSSILVSRRVLLLFASVVLLNAIGQCVAQPRYYLMHFEMWMSLVTGILSIVVATKSCYEGYPKTSLEIGIEDLTLNATNVENRIKPADVGDDPNYSWVPHVISVTILLSWAEVMFLIGRFPTWGSHALLFYAVLKNVLKVLLAFGCLIMGFSFSFFVQFHKSKTEAFGDPWKAFVKTMVMMMGEFEYLDLFKEEKSDDHTDNLLVMNRVIFISFVILVSIVLVNLMVGLAVSDAQALCSEGEARRLLKQAEFVAHLERGVSAVVSWRWLPRCVHDWLSNRRAILTHATVWPSAPSNWSPYHFPSRLTDDLVDIALRRRPMEHDSTCCCHQDRSAYIGAENEEALPGSSRSLLMEIKATLETLCDGQRKSTQSVPSVRKCPSANAPRSRASHSDASEVRSQNFIMRSRRRKRGGSVEGTEV